MAPSLFFILSSCASEAFFPFPKTGQLWSLGNALLALAGRFAILKCEKYPLAMMTYAFGDIIK